MRAAYEKWQAALEQGDLPLAEQYYHRMRLSPQEPRRVSYLMGQWYRNVHELEAAAAALARAVDIDRDDRLEILLELADTLMEGERWPEAEQCLAVVLAQAPAWPEAHYSYGRLLAQMGQPQAARRELCQVLAARIGDTETFITVAVDLSALGFGEEAIDVYFQALIWAPDNGFLYSNIGVELAELGDYQDALCAHRRGLALLPENADLWYNLACTYSLMEQAEAGLHALAQAIALDEANKACALGDDELAFLRAQPEFWPLLNK